MYHEALLYSHDHEITSKQLKSKEQIFYDEQRYARLQDRVEEENIGAIFSSAYQKFAPIKSQPYIIYYIGDISLLDKKILGIVGPRKMSSYGQIVIELLFSSAAEYDMVTISGMAEGVDQLCHSLSRENAIPTIAVLGGGLGWYFKRPERTIIQQIVAGGGLVLSEFRLLEQPAPYTFPQRNRIIAGLSDLLFLPEAGKKSGSLITVECALAMKKPVYATPSSIFSSTSEGILQLIENGSVKPIVDLRHFLHQHFSTKNISSRPQTTILLDDKEQSIISLLSRDQGVAIQEIVSETGEDVQDIIQVLMMLEIKGVIDQERPGAYILK